MPDLTPPDWDDEKRMAAWVDAMLDAEAEAAVMAANSIEAVKATSPLFEPVEALLQNLNEGTANPLQQWRAAELITAARARRRPGPKPKAKIDRDTLLTMTARDARRIMGLWREHYRKRDLPRAVKIACKRWIDREGFSREDQDKYESAMFDLEDSVLLTLRRPRWRNFGAQ
ncbi:MAG TPA: hypothetical protein VF637_01765 [Sphingomicrobium sp.]|jgi:hypothetical protein